MSSVAPSFDWVTLAAVLDEISRVAVPSKVQKIQQPEPSTIVLSLYGHHGAQRLLIVAGSGGAQSARLHLTQRRFENPVNAPGFCQVCRKWLDGAILSGVALPANDRLARLEFRSPDFGSVALIAELMGRNANLALVSSDAGGETVRGVLRPTAPDSPRPLVVGGKYNLPPGFGEGGGAAAGKFLRAEADARGGVDALVRAVRSGEFSPHSLADETGASVGVWGLEPLSIPPDRRFPRESVSVALDTFFATNETRQSDDSKRASLQKSLAKEIAFREKSRADALRTIEEAVRADELDQNGNLLLAALSTIAKGETSASVPDFYSPEPGALRTIALDSKKSPHENAQSCFSRAKKARDAAEYADSRLANFDEQIERLQEIDAVLESAADSDLESLQARVDAIVARPKSVQADPKSGGERPFDGHKVRSYRLDGFLFLVGENALANDHLLGRASSPSDLWMHVRASTGAHGVLKTEGHPERVPDAVVRRAAAIVAAKSGKEKHSSLVPVDVVERRHVRKPRRGKPGQALYERGKTYDVRPELP